MDQKYLIALTGFFGFLLGRIFGDRPILVSLSPDEEIRFIVDERVCVICDKEPPEEAQFQKSWVCVTYADPELEDVYACSAAHMEQYIMCGKDDL